MWGRTREVLHGQIWLVDCDAEVKFVKVGNHSPLITPLNSNIFLFSNMENASFFKVHISGTSIISWELPIQLFRTGRGKGG